MKDVISLMKFKVKKFSIICVIGIAFILVMVAVVFFNITYTPKHRLEWWLKDIGCDNSHMSYTGKGIRIAVIDSGVDSSHDDLQNRIELETSVIKSKNAKQDLKHGTAISGIICAFPKTENGLLGVAPDASIISIDITDRDDGKIKTDDLIMAIYTAIESDVDIINVSCGVQDYSIELEKAVEEAYCKNIIVIAAAGNNMIDSILYPAACDYVIAVGAKSKSGKLLSPTGNLNKKVFYLPGENIVTLSVDNSYMSISGTSASTAIMSGMVSLLLESNPDITAQDVYNKLNNINTETVKLYNIIN